MSQTQTKSVADAQITLSGRINGLFPPQLPPAYTNLTKLTREQAGHIRHIHNIVSQIDGEWRFMGTQEPGQEWLDGYRYQLATMAYAIAAAQYHRMPAARSVFKPLMGRIIHKMLRREVWGYWFLTSHSGSLVDPDLKELRKPWADPICRENIMYSGHLLLMTALYAMLFDDDKYEQPDSLVFNWNPVYWGFGPERYSYNRSTLQEQSSRRWKQTDGLGSAASQIWCFSPATSFPYSPVDALDIGFPAWAAAHMAWNVEQMEDLYNSMAHGYLSKIGDRVNINPDKVARAIRKLSAENPTTDAAEIHAKARALTAKEAHTYPSFMHPVFGWVIEWAAEIGPPEDLNGLLKHADQFLGPKWLDGGLYYPRHDVQYDENDNHVYVEPFTGNAGIAYARLTVKRGQATMWDKPWTREHVGTMPWIDGVGLDSGVDTLSGVWDEGKGAMFASFRTWHGEPARINPVFNMLPIGHYGIYINGNLNRENVIRASGESISVSLDVSGSDTDVVIVRQSIN
ncbi:hypothetical protein THAR02_10015 [Trichoderma harzianum]|uniref:Linalool dehydratase/isomerase domain-containing protein n=1 Tax=Trichoderma harzianum TaxID=5544 RepID=A0A0F9WZL6_TRIHA|nr:hypothetical protein THAR02_10015 [Trichoderma harzianum]